MASDGRSFDEKVLFFKFDLENNPVSAGQTISAGKGGSYFWEYAKQQREEGLFETDKETAVEITGMARMGGIDPDTGNVIPMEYIKPIIRKQNVDNIFVNELMSPWVNGYSLNPGAFNIGSKNCLFTGGKGYGSGILTSGPRTGDGIVGQTSLKVGPSSSLDVEIKFPLTTDGGVATIDHNIVIAFFCNVVRTEELYQELLAYHGHLATDNSGNQLVDSKGNPLVDQSFVIGDVENLTAVQSIAKQVPATLSSFEELNGGNRAQAPFITRDLRYVKNGQATTLNNWYTMEYVNRQVLAPEMEMAWNFEEEEAISITHLGLIGTEHLKWLRLERSGALDQMEYDVSPYMNHFQPAVARNIGENIYRGPVELLRPFTVHNRKGSIKMADDGVATVPAWGANTRGIELQTFGYHYYM